jgi:hypothetical protein
MGDSQIGGDRRHTDAVTDVHWHLPDDHTHCSLPAHTHLISYPPDAGDTMTVAHIGDH